MANRVEIELQLRPIIKDLLEGGHPPAYKNKTVQYDLEEREF